MSFKVVFKSDPSFDVRFGSDESLRAEFMQYMGGNYKCIHSDTTDGWAGKPDTVGYDGHLYVYMDYVDEDGEDIPGIKVGDGRSLLADLPFVAGNIDVARGGGLPEGGRVGDVLMKVRDAADGGEWVTPASSAEKDNTRPITAAAVYTEIGNINALLATI